MREEQDLSALEEIIGYRFENRELLKQALTHSSYANERCINKSENYERLEFLGDAVLELVSSEFLFRGSPGLPEGKMTKLRASMVCESALAFCARDIRLEEYILLGKGEECTGGRRRDSITSDVMEAVIGAIYLDGGMAPAKAYIDRFVLSDLEHKKLFYDSKSNLQEVVQENSKRVWCMNCLMCADRNTIRPFACRCAWGKKCWEPEKGTPKRLRNSRRRMRRCYCSETT